MVHPSASTSQNKTHKPQAGNARAIDALPRPILRNLDGTIIAPMSPRPSLFGEKREPNFIMTFPWSFPAEFRVRENGSKRQVLDLALSTHIESTAWNPPQSLAGRSGENNSWDIYRRAPLQTRPLYCDEIL
jgi:hypothetical protein